jgi:hypothetical protein
MSASVYQDDHNLHALITAVVRTYATDPDYAGWWQPSPARPT